MDEAQRRQVTGRRIQRIGPRPVAVYAAGPDG